MNPTDEDFCVSATYQWRPGYRHQVAMLPDSKLWECKDCHQQFETWPSDDQACPGPSNPAVDPAPDPELEADRQVIANTKEERCHNCGVTLADTDHVWASLGVCEIYVPEDQHARLQHDLHQAQAKVQRLEAQLRREPCEDCYERCCGTSDQCVCHMRPWDALDRPVAAEQDGDR